ncbi:5-formyltetrahydrofolate cyclo-ligase [Pseudomonas sp. R1-43-08]|nr:5-formyltetrahydrofolate cyclo-ligase [Pseudomonas sp. R1-43-08]
MTEPAPLSRPQLRRMLRKARRALTPREQRQAACGLYRQLAQHPLFRRAKHISLYLPTDGEIDPRLLLRAAQRQGKATYLPVLSAWPRTKMVFQRVRPGDKLLPNRFRILEPRANARHQRKVWALDLVLLPLVGFDNEGGRLGMGADSMTAAWPTSPGEKPGASRRCWGWPMNVSKSIAWRRRAGTCRWRALSPISNGLSQKRRWNRDAVKTVLTLELLLHRREFNRRIGLVRPQALGIPGGHDAQTKQNYQNP